MLNSLTLHRLLQSYEFGIYRSETGVPEYVDLNHIDEHREIVVVKINEKFEAIAVYMNTTEKDVLEAVKRLEDS